MSNATIQKYLTEQPFFTGIAPQHTGFLSHCVHEKQLDKNAVLFHQGEPAQTFYLVREGDIAVEIPAIQGPMLEVQRIGAGQILGWSWLIPPYKWNFQARAESPCTLLEFDGSTVLAHCEAEPAFGYDMMKRFAALMSERLDAARLKMMDRWNPPGFA